MNEPMECQCGITTATNDGLCFMGIHQVAPSISDEAEAAWKLTDEERDLLRDGAFDSFGFDANALVRIVESIIANRLRVALTEAATQIRTEAQAANGKVPERYFSGLMDAADYLDRAARQEEA